MVKRFRLRHAPTDIAAGAGAVWVKGDGRLARIDPDTGEATRTIRLPETVENGDLPFQNWGFPQVAVGAGAVWAINDDRTVSRIDADSGRRVARIVVDAATIAAGREGVWFISADDTRAVTRIDPRTNRVRAEDPGRSPEPLGRRCRGRPCVGDRGGGRRRVADRTRAPAGPPDV